MIRGDHLVACFAHLVSEIEQQLAGAAVPDEGPLIAADQIILWKADAQNRDAEPVRGIDRVGVADQKFRAPARAVFSRSSRSPIFTSATGTLPSTAQ